MARIAFYAPMKPPGHPVPSGDRRVARLLMTALGLAGHDVMLASRFRSYDGKGDAARQAALAREGAREAGRLVARWSGLLHPPPQAWFTYHLYHKAPDHLGPAVCRALGIPYLVAEPSIAAKRAEGPWAAGYAAAREAILAADVLMPATPHDAEALAPLVARRRLVPLRPFLDTAPFQADPPARPRFARRYGLDPARPLLLAVGMMRPGAKLESYRLLARALARVRDPAWQLLVVGDGPAREEVSRALAPLGQRVRHAGQLAAGPLRACYLASDLFVWPGVGEAYGMAYLEAQAAGLPVVAGDEPGVRAVVRHGQGGLLVECGEAGAFAAAVDRLLAHPALRRRLGAAARRRILAFHGLDGARRTLARALAVARVPAPRGPAR